MAIKNLCNKHFWTMGFSLLLALAASPPAIAAVWDGGAPGNGFCESANWNPNGVPGPTGTALINLPATSAVAAAGCNATVYDLRVGDTTTANLNVSGATLDAAWRGALGLQSGGQGSLTVTSGTLTFGAALWIGNNGSGTLTVNGGTVTTGWLSVPQGSGGNGHVQLNGGTLNAAMFQSQGSGSIDIAGGTLVLNGSDPNAYPLSLFANFLAQGKVTAYGGQGTLNVAYGTPSGKTTVSATPPAGPPPTSSVTLYGLVKYHENDRRYNPYGPEFHPLLDGRLAWRDNRPVGAIYARGNLGVTKSTWGYIEANGDWSYYLDGLGDARTHGHPYFVRFSPLMLLSDSPALENCGCPPDLPVVSNADGTKFVPDLSQPAVQARYENWLREAKRQIVDRYPDAVVKVDIAHPGLVGEARRDVMRDFFGFAQYETMIDQFDAIHLRVFGANTLISNIDGGLDNGRDLASAGVLACRQDGFGSWAKYPEYDGFIADPIASLCFDKGVVIAEQWGGSILDFESDPVLLVTGDLGVHLNLWTDVYSVCFAGFMGWPVDQSPKVGEVDSMLLRMKTYCPARVAAWFDSTNPPPPPGPTSCPSGWSCSDVGSVAVAEVSATAAQIDLTASGKIYDTSDAFHFIHQELSGDFDLRVKVSAISGPNGWAKGGLMVRDSLATNAPNVFAHLTNTSNHRVGVQWRTSPGGSTSAQWSWGQTLALPRWLRVVRTGNSFATYHSAATQPGANDWTLARTVTVAMSGSVHVGLALASTSSSQAAQATFSQLTLTP